METNRWKPFVLVKLDITVYVFHSAIFVLLYLSFPSLAHSAASLGREYPVRTPTSQCIHNSVDIL